MISYAETLDPFQPDKILWTANSDGSFVELKISWCKSHKNGIRLGLQNVVNRNQAEAIVGLQLFIDKCLLPQLEEDTYYWFDLIGLRVKTTTDELIGYIDNIIPTNGNDVYVIKRADDTGESECLIPAVGNFIRSIDLDSGTMTVDLPEGL